MAGMKKDGSPRNGMNMVIPGSSPLLYTGWANLNTEKLPASVVDELMADPVKFKAFVMSCEFVPFKDKAAPDTTAVDALMEGIRNPVTATTE